MALNSSPDLLISNDCHTKTPLSCNERCIWKCSHCDIWLKSDTPVGDTGVNYTGLPLKCISNPQHALLESTLSPVVTTSLINSGICEHVWTWWMDKWRMMVGGWGRAKVTGTFITWQKTSVWLLISGSEIWCTAKQWASEERLIVWDKTKDLITHSAQPDSPPVDDSNQKGKEIMEIQCVSVNMVM